MSWTVLQTEEGGPLQTVIKVNSKYLAVSKTDAHLTEHITSSRLMLCKDNKEHDFLHIESDDYQCWRFCLLYLPFKNNSNNHQIFDLTFRFTFCFFVQWYCETRLSHVKNKSNSNQVKHSLADRNTFYFVSQESFCSVRLPLDFVLVINVFFFPSHLKLAEHSSLHKYK